MIPRLYEKIELNDGREGIVVDYIPDNLLLVDMLNEENEWETVKVINVGGFYEILENNERVYNLNQRKEIRMVVTNNQEYWFLMGDKFREKIFTLKKEQYHWLCTLLEIDINEPEKGWNSYFEYHNLTPFLNAYKFVTTENGYYYVYGYDKVEKAVDALYRCIEGKFERYFPCEECWRELPEQRMILNDKKPRHEWVTKEEGMALALLS